MKLKAALASLVLLIVCHAGNARADSAALHRAVAQMICTQDTDSVLTLTGLSDPGPVNFRARKQHLETNTVKHFVATVSGAEPFVLTCGLSYPNSEIAPGVHALTVEADHPFSGQIVLTHYRSRRRLLSIDKGPLSSSSHEITSAAVSQPCDPVWWATTSAAQTCQTPSMLAYDSDTDACSVQTQCADDDNEFEDASIEFKWTGCNSSPFSSKCALINCDTELEQLTRCGP